MSAQAWRPLDRDDEAAAGRPLPGIGGGAANGRAADRELTRVVAGHRDGSRPAGGGGTVIGTGTGRPSIELVSILAGQTSESIGVGAGAGESPQPALISGAIRRAPQAHEVPEQRRE